MAKAGGGNSSGGDSASSEWHYACCPRGTEFFCQHPSASETWQTPRRGATDIAGTKGRVLLRALSGMADVGPHIMKWPAWNPSVSINGGSKAPVPQCELLLFI